VTNLINSFRYLRGLPQGTFLVRKGDRYLYVALFEIGFTDKREMAWPFEMREQAEEYAERYGGRVIQPRNSKRTGMPYDVEREPSPKRPKA